MNETAQATQATPAPPCANCGREFADHVRVVSADGPLPIYLCPRNVYVPEP